MKIRQLTITTIVLLASSLTVAGCGDPKLDCPGVTACKASAEAIAKEMRMTDAETEKFKKNLEAFPAVTLLNEFKAAKTREAFDAFYNFNSRKMPRDQMEKFAMNLLNGKTAKEVNDFIDANKGAKEEIRKIEEEQNLAPDISQLDREENKLFALANEGVKHLMEISPLVEDEKKTE